MNNLVKDLVSSTDPILRQKTEKFDFSNPPIDPSYLAHTLAQTMIHNSGIGLSASQIGLPYRCFVMTGEKIICCFNPLIVDKSSEQEYLEEGCLSFPNLLIKIKRPKLIKVRYTQPNGDVITSKFIGMTARVFQHEMDHLDGILYTDKATTYHLDQAKKRRDVHGKRIGKV